MQALANGVTMVNWNGGDLGGVTMLVSDSQTAGRLTVVDGTGLAVALQPLELRASEQATIEMDTAPSMESGTSATESTVVSAFQSGLRILIAERAFAIKPIRPNAYAHTTNVGLADDGDSPSYS